jgi:phosphonate transport system substrate-binding protein
MLKKIIVICILLFAVSACTKTDTDAPLPAKEAGPALKPLLIGLIPERNLFDQIKRYEPLADYISGKIGRKIELTVLPRYGNIIDNFVSSGIDAAFFGSFTYTLAHAKLGVEVIARPESLDGTSTYYGLIFVRKDSGISSGKDIKGKVFVFVDKATTAGYLLPLAFFKTNGIDDYRTYLKESYFAGTHEDSIYDVLNRRADIGAAKNTVFEIIQDTDSRIKDGLLILGRSADVPENGLAVRKDLENSIKNKLRETLLSMHNEPDGMVVLKDFGARRFIKTEDNDYSGVYEFIKKIDLDLSTYDYVND